MRLYFLRHGIAVNPEDWNADDSTRPLTDEGRDRMVKEAATFAQWGLALDYVLTSPYVRAFATAEIVARKLKLMDHLVKEEGLASGFGMRELTKILEKYTQSKALMLVGHEPDFSQVIGRLIGGGRVEVKKGGIACVEVTNLATPEGILLWLAPPKLIVA